MSTNDSTPTPLDAHTAPAAPLDLAEPAAPRKRRRWVLPTVIGVVAFLVGIAAGQGDASEPDAAAAPPTVKASADVTTTPEYAAVVAERDAAVKRAESAESVVAERDTADKAAADAAAAAAAAGPAPLTEGMYIVGSTIEAGRYSMVSAPGSMGGYVDQQNGDDYLAQEVGADDGATMIVDIANVPGSLVTFRGVTDIVKIG